MPTEPGTVQLEVDHGIKFDPLDLGTWVQTRDDRDGIIYIISTIS